MSTRPVAGLCEAVGERAVLPAGRASELFKAAMTSRYPAPTVKMSYWLVYPIPVTGSMATLKDGSPLLAVFIRRALTASGVTEGVFCGNKSGRGRWCSN